MISNILILFPTALYIKLVYTIVHDNLVQMFSMSTQIPLPLHLSSTVTSSFPKYLINLALNNSFYISCYNFLEEWLKCFLRRKWRSYYTLILYLIKYCHRLSLLCWNFINWDWVLSTLPPIPSSMLFLDYQCCRVCGVSHALQSIQKF